MRNTYTTEVRTLTKEEAAIAIKQRYAYLLGREQAAKREYVKAQETLAYFIERHPESKEVAA